MTRVARHRFRIGQEWRGVSLRRAMFLIVVAGVATILLGCEEAAPEPTEPPIERPPEPEPTAPEVHVLSKSELDSGVLAVTGRSLSFARPVAYRQGDFITAEISAKTPYGMLREVTSVSADRQTVMTSEASLEDVLIEGTVTISGTLTPADLTPASRAALVESGLVAAPASGLAPAAARELRFGYDLSATDGASTLSGRIDFVLGYELTANYDGGLKNMRFSITPSSVLTVEVSAEGSFRKEWQLGELSFAPRRIPRLPFPVYFTPQMELYAGVDGGFKASVSARHTASVTVGATCADDCGNPESWHDISESAQLNASGVSFEARTAGQVRIYVAPKLTFNLVGRFGGPYLKALPYLRARAAKESGAECLHRALDAGLSGQLGGEARVTVPIWGRTLISARLDEYEFAISGPVVLWEEPCEEEPPADTEPSFGAQRVQDQAFTVGTAITALPLPAASGGNAPLTYSLRPDIPGLQFDVRARTLSGTPTATGVHTMTYRVVDSDLDAATLSFVVRINPRPGYVAFWTDATRGWSRISVRFDGSYIGALTRYRDEAPSCHDSSASSVIVTRAPGTYSYSAEDDSGNPSWSGEVTVTASRCLRYRIHCGEDRDCSPERTCTTDRNGFNSCAADAFGQLAARTGGAWWKAGSASEVPNAILAAINKAVSAGGRSFDLMFIIDVTGSMRDDISAIKSQITQIIDRIRSNGDGTQRVGLALYSDRCVTGRWFRFQDLTGDLDLIRRQVQGIGVSGGGDIPESVYDAILETIRNASWGREARYGILIGDAPPHERGDSCYMTTLEEAVSEARSTGIEVNLFPILVAN